ncbi:MULTISPECIES: helix-turn-helix domain-containing protein [Rickettsieae]|jgi:transcriptional regulator with XRE-family HTH domain|uniref:helix-turn-helix domain-containing protein n=1 Tax=Rickettsieae TaxID=33988 RepID=UPI000B9AB1BC|nr:helix-turn-helix transcriptional regulator [Rickettsia endosymbiont of Culicoides newsteadi]OZG31475.1 transcriptional regulator [Rickettsia endosymbiont of Culicoides newsteadi]
MSYNALQKNLEKLIKDHNYQIADLERKAGLRKNNVYNIIKGISRKPSAELLQAVADVFGLTVKDLFTMPTESYPFLTSEDLDLLIKVAEQVIIEIKAQQLSVSCNDATLIINEVFNYSSESKLTLPDEKFIKWVLKHKYNQR